MKTPTTIETVAQDRSVRGRLVEVQKIRPHV